VMTSTEGGTWRTVMTK